MNQDSYQQALQEVTARLRATPNPSLQQHWDSNLVQNLISLTVIKKASLLSLGNLEEPEYLGLEHFVLTHGTYYRGQDLADKHLKYRGFPKLCYQNSYQTAKKTRNRLKYVEGFTLIYIPMSHAWNLDSEGKVVETTLNPNLFGRDYLLKDVEYFGITFENLEYVGQCRDREMPVIDDWGRDWPLLRDPEILDEARHD